MPFCLVHWCLDGFVVVAPIAHAGAGSKALLVNAPTPKTVADSMAKRFYAPTDHESLIQGYDLGSYAG